MSRLLTLVVTGVSALALSTVSAPVSTVDHGHTGAVSSAGTSAKARTGNWCC